MSMKPKYKMVNGRTMSALLISAAIFAGCSKKDSGYLPENEPIQTEASVADESANSFSAAAARTGLLFDGGFEGTTPFAGMSTSQTATSYGITASTEQANEGTKSFKSVVKKTDPSISGGYRAEVTFPGISDQGEMWYGYSTYFESIPLGGGHVVQWHPNNSTGSATLSLWTGDGKFMVVRNPSGTNQNTYQSNTQTIIAKKWYDIVWHVKWSSSSTGIIEMWIDGVLYFSYTGVTAQTGVYFKLGQNLWVRDNDGIIFYDNIRIGGSSSNYASVAPETGSTPPPPTTPPPSGTNQVPVVNAGPNQSIVLPINKVTLSGSATDADGTIAGYKWTKVSGPSAGAYSVTAPTTTVPNLKAGTYVFNLRATDNQGATANSRVTVTVAASTAPPPPANLPPTVSAGTAQTITLPTNSVTLRGTASDPDGTIASYKWSKVSGPTGGTTSATTINTTVTSMTAGTYTYNLKVTDNAGATANSNVIVIVNAAITNPPVGFGTLTFQTGYDVASDVNTNQGPRNSVSYTIKKSGAGSFRSEVRASDQSTSSGYRGEMQYNGSNYNPTEGVIEYDVYYEGWKNFGGGGHSMQWHPNNGTGSATVALYSYGGKFQVVRNLGSKYGGANYYQSGTLQTIAPNTWYKLRWEIKWAESGGYVKLYVNDALYYSYTGETMNSTTGMPYMKVGQNRWSMPSGTNTVVYYDNLKVYKK